ncbi:MAG TPA: hypothetical protein VKP11_07085, partial [Frankiaceae bacterium]|nr:hypothetical protein [Frankiaceae bacterium]
YELTERVTVLRALALVVNVALVVYLLLSKRLFGLRGGRAAYEDERADESLLEVRQSAGVTVADPARPPTTSQAPPPATDPAGRRPGLARHGDPPAAGGH